MNVDLLKEHRISDDRNLFCKIQISYSELGKISRITNGMTSTAGVEGVVGLYESEVVGYQVTLFSNKPSLKIFRIAFSSIESIEMKKGVFGLNYHLIIADEQRRYKLVTSRHNKFLLEKIYETIQKEK